MPTVCSALEPGCITIGSMNVTLVIDFSLFQSAMPSTLDYEENPDNTQFQKWLYNSKRYELVVVIVNVINRLAVVLSKVQVDFENYLCLFRYRFNCDMQVKAVLAGTSTLTELFNNQRSLIQQIGRERRVTTKTDELPPSSLPVREVPDDFADLTLPDLLGMASPCPASLIGTPDSNRFRMWLDNCQRYNFCAEEHINQVYAGRMSLYEMMDEQDALINEIAEHYIRRLADGPELLVRFKLPDLYRLDNPCPQALQGEDRENFMIWLENCAKYGSTADGEAQLLDVQTGRKTLREVFEEQKWKINNHVARGTERGVDHCRMDTGLQNARSDNTDSWTSKVTLV